MRPAPKKVATRVAQRGAGLTLLTNSVWFFDMLVRVAGVVRFWVIQRRRNHIPAARPFTQVDQAASITAEREIRITGEHKLAAGRAPQTDFTFSRHGST
jgi:hypothetical protein